MLKLQENYKLLLFVDSKLYSKLVLRIELSSNIQYNDEFFFPNLPLQCKKISFNLSEDESVFVLSYHSQHHTTTVGINLFKSNTSIMEGCFDKIPSAPSIGALFPKFLNIPLIDALSPKFPNSPSIKVFFPKFQLPLYSSKHFLQNFQFLFSSMHMSSNFLTVAHVIK